jgi:hypothetical protein
MTAITRDIGFNGSLDVKVLKHYSRVDEVKPAPLTWKVKNALRPSFINGWLGTRIAKFASRNFPITSITSELNVKKFDYQEAIWVDYGAVGYHVVTSIGAETVADAFAGTVSPVYNFHGIGSGSTAAGVGDTSLETEYTTDYIDDSTRATGTQTKETGSPQVYETVATNTVDAAPNQAKEHGIFSNATAGSSGSLLDRTVFAEISLAASDAIQSTYRLTIQAGG